MADLPFYSLIKVVNGCAHLARTLCCRCCMEVHSLSKPSTDR